MNALLEAALSYERQGFSVVPLHTPTEGGCSCKKRADCPNPGKHARVKWLPLQERRATESDIRRWWARWPDANVGIVTGEVSDIVVLDVDGEQGRAAIHGKHMPLTVTVLTGREGGEHRWFKHPGFECRNAAESWPDGNDYPHLDFRGDAGIIVCPPSLHASGKTYRFADGLELGEVDREPCPSWLLTMLTANHSKPVATVHDDGGIIGEGKRKSTLMKLAGAMRRQGACEESIFGAIYFENKRRCQPPLEESELSEVAASAAKYEPAPDTTPAAMPTVTLETLLTEQMEPARWLVDKLVPETGLTMLCGDSGVGKSWLGYHLALCLTAGEPFLDTSARSKARR
jgi:hypothetical protein